MERDILKSAQYFFQERSVMYEFIQKHKNVYLIEKICQTLKVIRSAYYYWTTKKPSEIFICYLDIGVVVKKVYDWFKGRYGSLRITKELQMGGIEVSSLLISSIMKNKNIRSSYYCV